MLLTILLICAADQRNCCDNCVSSGYPWKRIVIITIFFCIFITMYCQILRKLNTGFAVMSLVEE